MWVWLHCCIVSHDVFLTIILGKDASFSTNIRIEATTYDPSTDQADEETW